MSNGAISASSRSATCARSVEPGQPAKGKRRRRGEADTAGGAAKKKTQREAPRSVYPHQCERSQCKECGEASICEQAPARKVVWGVGVGTLGPAPPSAGVFDVIKNFKVLQGSSEARASVSSAEGANARSF
jgi:hypothetical protein